MPRSKGYVTFHQSQTETSETKSTRGVCNILTDHLMYPITDSWEGQDSLPYPNNRLGPKIIRTRRCPFLCYGLSSMKLRSAVAHHPLCSNYMTHKTNMAKSREANSQMDNSSYIIEHAS